MSDLEWYLDVGGKQSGPHSAREIVEMVRGGKIPASSQVTAARMNGDWVTAQDLVDAYDELYTKPKIAVPVSEPDGPAFRSGPSGPFTAPPRPTEQLEQSKIITLNRGEEDATPDPTDALFQAIQAVREKATQKTVAAPTAPSAAARDSFGQLSRPSTRLQPLILIGALAAIFAITIYAATKLIGSKRAEQAEKSPPAAKRIEEPSPPRSAAAGGGLLNADGSGTSAARTAPPVRPRALPSKPSSAAAARDSRRDESRMHPVPEGGARYRDDRDSVADEPDVDEMDVDPNRELPEPMPVDPSEVPSDRILPESGSYPVRRNPYENGGGDGNSNEEYPNGIDPYGGGASQ